MKKAHLTKLILSLCASSLTPLCYGDAVGDSTPVAVDFGAGSKYDGWYNLSNNTTTPMTKVIHGEEHDLYGSSGYGGFPGSGAWPSPIDSQLQSNAGAKATLDKVANGSGGGPYPASSGIYYGGFNGDPNINGGILGVNEASPLSGLGTIVFQVQIGEAFTYDYYDDATLGLQVPSLTLNFDGDSPVTLSADFSELIYAAYNGTIEMPTGPGGTMQDEDLFINLYGYQWDVSDYSDVVSFDIEFTAVQHAQLYALQLDQSTVDYGNTSMIPVPEPETWALVFGSAAFLIGIIRRKRRV